MPVARKHPTLDQVRRWAATCNVEQGAEALGVSRATMYQSIADGTCPVQTIVVSHRIKILTSSLISVLEGRGDRAAS